MLELFLLLMERAGLMVLLAYVLLYIPRFKEALVNRQAKKDYLLLLLVFAAFAVFANLSGIEILSSGDIVPVHTWSIQAGSAIANFRVVIIGIAGLIGGFALSLPIAALSAGIRWLQGGDTAYIYVISSLCIGLASAYLARFFPSSLKTMNSNRAALSLMSLELIQLGLIALLSPSSQEANSLLQVIALPMLVTDGMGVWLFLSIIQQSLRDLEWAKISQTKDIFRMTQKILPYFSQQMSQESAEVISLKLYENFKLQAIAVYSSMSQLYAYPKSLDLGPEAIKHFWQSYQDQEQIEKLLKKGNFLALPIFVKKDLKTLFILEFKALSDVSSLLEEILIGLSQIFSMQYELKLAEENTRLLKDAKIKSLQAQVNPHFFFNAMNTISSLVRLDPNRARQLLIELSHYFRANLNGARSEKISLTQELEHVQAYLSIIQARFPDRYQVTKEIDPACLDLLIPPFVLQMLVENAIQHAFENKANKADQALLIRVHLQDQALSLSVSDNGTGIAEAKLAAIFNNESVPSKGNGTALNNIRQRLKTLYNDQAQFKIDSSPAGTRVHCLIPIERKND
ncbi:MULTISPECIES: LytS/YhcK type 5TM receptor domain-containing protein [Aerococcus]|uniref:Histidine kinase domain-containing protein n=1 Tax=Aerococcus sanguinicola TaxID=119206 RepID=A0A5N1GLW7_9LACT|nr:MULTISPECIES: LytS/YhcK type 5TM receptor domain-containing protein [Aerococcus]KAA9301967.1 hypothetical protein F6I03_01805 [Aerococcus sanguinicola]MDK6368608.1 LytS/YhcK type 5TM receptor domain-containing protein [Aerococcus sp. UMB9870]MDK6679691.1 LytS/YhcK type 5TM receptor domain-containing protein [Aerococcus sp. UMB8608]MDK6686037.1 LytS/YhcK type 5TM receptor domain-containing protein [Aerococcus sp. UMB8623]MDK6940843.1 LytS/YhcK type 5TM receptor domain-containing protein [Aer